MKNHVDEIISLINFTSDKLDKASEGLETYDDDSESDHGDGRCVGREEAYLEILRECGRRLQKI
ncbi:hypothetical protein [Neptuniibacter pectenicola]|mgnify:FL=1|uniref:hypothetical protein n=1 Tax=Neptuniibacter pectenicola TaxID=1806669 RepID=UPI0030EC1869